MKNLILVVLIVLVGCTDSNVKYDHFADLLEDQRNERPEKPEPETYYHTPGFPVKGPRRKD